MVLSNDFYEMSQYEMELVDGGGVWGAVAAMGVAFLAGKAATAVGILEVAGAIKY